MNTYREKQTKTKSRHEEGKKERTTERKKALLTCIKNESQKYIVAERTNERTTEAGTRHVYTQSKR